MRAFNSCWTQFGNVITNLLLGTASIFECVDLLENTIYTQFVFGTFSKVYLVLTEEHSTLFL